MHNWEMKDPLYFKVPLWKQGLHYSERTNQWVWICELKCVDGS